LDRVVYSLVPGGPGSLHKGGEFPDAKTLTIDTIDGNFEEGELNESHVIVQDMVGATLYLNGCPPSLKLSKLTNCKLICGPVHTTILIEYCRNCVFFLVGPQLRITNSEALDMFTRVKTKSILEESTNIRFAPYRWSYKRSDELQYLVQFDKNNERFDLIEDFNWLAFSTPSPNWLPIPEEERYEFPEAELPEKEISNYTDGSKSLENPTTVHNETLIQFPGAEDLSEEGAVQYQDNGTMKFTGAVFPLI